MEEFDQQRAERVWQRVCAGTEAREPAMAGLLHQSHSLAGLYLGLSRRLSGKAAGLARQLYQEHQHFMTVLRGACCLTGESAALPPLEHGTGRIREILEGCYLREQRLARGLEQCRTESIQKACAILAQNGWERTLCVLELLGMTGRES